VRRHVVWWVTASLAGVSTTAVAQLRILGFDPPPPYCTHREVPDDAPSEVVETFTFSAADAQVPQIHWITAGDTVTLRMPSSGLSGLHASVYVKPFGN
jgi:hypothetical protein